MGNSARLFYCARCRRQVKICRRCDRGNLYCGTRCSQPARRESLRAAGRRYQSSRRGRFKQAERQRRYRSRRHKVTHQGSPATPHDDVLRPEPKGTGAHRGEIGVQGIRCYFCKRLCSAFVRLGFLHSPGPRLERPPWRWPPRMGKSIPGGGSDE